MRYLFLLLSLLCGSHLSASETVILGKIKNPKDRLVVLNIPPLEVGGDFQLDTFQLNERDAFRFQLDLAKATMASVIHAGIEFPIFIHPEHSLVIRLSANSESKAVVNFKGKGSYDNQFYASYLNYLNRRRENKSLEQLQKTSTNAFKKFTLERAERQRSFIHSYQKDHPNKLSSQLLDWIYNDIQYRTAELLINYPALLRQSNKYVNRVELPNFYYDFLNEVKINNEAAMHQPAYQNFITAYFYNYQASNNSFIDSNQNGLMLNYSINYHEELYDYIDDFFKGTPRQYLQSVVLRKEIINYPDELKKRYYSYLVSDAPALLKQQVKKAFAQQKNPIAVFQKILTGEHISASAFRQINNSPLPHDVFENKISYLFFWSENSTQSIVEIRHFKSLAKKYTDHPYVNIMLVNTDADIKEWERAAIQFKYRLNGLNVMQLHLHESALPQSLKEYFDIHTPSFLIVGSEGRIINDQNLAPSSRKVPQILEKHLNTLRMSKR